MIPTMTVKMALVLLLLCLGKRPHLGFDSSCPANLSQSQYLLSTVAWNENGFWAWLHISILLYIVFYRVFFILYILLFLYLYFLILIIFVFECTCTLSVSLSTSIYTLPPLITSYFHITQKLYSNNFLRIREVVDMLTSLIFFT